MIKYLYEDWWQGKVWLSCSDRRGTFKEEPEPVDWENFSDFDIKKIRERQKLVFEKLVTVETECFKEIFNNSINNSSDKIRFISKQIGFCKYLLFNETPSKDLNITKHTFGIKNLEEIREYYNQVLIDGNVDSYYYINSPNCKYKEELKPVSQVYAKAILNYYEWLLLKLKTNNRRTKKDTEEQNICRSWFKVGFLFANGEMEKLILKHKNGTMTNYTAIANELGNINFRPYISESISNKNKTNKNIFSNKEKISFIINFCERTKIKIAESFYTRIKEFIPRS